jgi:hypothetical protein
MFTKLLANIALQIVNIIYDRTVANIHSVEAIKLVMVMDTLRTYT